MARTQGDETPGPPRINTIAMLGQAYSLLGFRIVDGVVGAGHPIKPNHSAVFAQIGPDGARLSELAAGAGITPQATGEIVDELESLEYVVRNPDPRDRRAKLITLTDRGRSAVEAGERTIVGLEQDIVAVLGERGHRQLRKMLSALLEQRPS